MVARFSMDGLQLHLRGLDGDGETVADAELLIRRFVIGTCLEDVLDESRKALWRQVRGVERELIAEEFWQECIIAAEVCS